LTVIVQTADQVFIGAARGFAPIIASQNGGHWLPFLFCSELVKRLTTSTPDVCNKTRRLERTGLL
jgi:hypothetical protein